MTWIVVKWAYCVLIAVWIFSQGDKNIIKFEGDHNSPRPQFYYDSVSIFFYNVLHPPPVSSTPSNKVDKYYDLGDLRVGAGTDEVFPVTLLPFFLLFFVSVLVCTSWFEYGSSHCLHLRLLPCEASFRGIHYCSCDIYYLGLRGVMVHHLTE